MASTSEIQAEILEPMRALFRVPFGIEDPERALTEYARALRRFKAEVLKSGWARILERYKRRDWPSIFDLVETFQTVDAEGRLVRDAMLAAEHVPEPFEAFCAKVLAFVKRDRRTFEAFRNAGVRAMHPTMTLAFDGDEDAANIRAEYGAALEREMGRPIEMHGPPIASPTSKWLYPKWETTKAYVP